MKKTATNKTIEELQREAEELRLQLEEANETIEAIRTGQIDALIVQGEKGHQLYTLKSADVAYRVFVEKMTEGAVTVSPQGLILYCNSRFASMVGQELSQVTGVPFVDFVAEFYKPQYLELFQKCWASDCKGEIWLLAGEQQVPVQLSLATMELEEGFSLSIILTDLTAQKRTQQQLRENNIRLEETNRALEVSNHDLQQFASIASHDLQEPLRKILMFANLLEEKQGDLSESSRKHLQKIIKSSSRMRSLIVDILTYSKLSAEDYQLECVDLNELLSELKEDFELIIADKAAKINIGHLPCIDVNRGQIRQVFQNIISNALKFSRAGIGPVITVESKRIIEKSFDSAEGDDGDYCMLTIKDNGIGFDQKYVQNIFSLFERLNSKDQYEGTGIGLAIAKKIVEKHGGLITARANVGDGAEFQIILPLRQNNIPGVKVQHGD